MNFLTYSETASRLLTHGRTWADGEMLHFNWTCAGFSLVFTGTYLAAELVPDFGLEYEGTPEAPTTRELWSWVCVFLDDETQPAARFEVRQPGSFVLFRSDKPETHRIRVVKLTENLKTFLAVSGFRMEGTLLDAPEKKRRAIEFVGDSITCGFGNEVADVNRGFYAEEENGWLTHAALAARALDMEWSQISISGICMGMRKEIPMPCAINTIYLDTDHPGQEKVGAPVAPWDFGSNPVDYVVVNVGTNDSRAVEMSTAPEAVIAAYERDYLAFLKLLRSTHGADTHIICAMGSMDYFLYSSVVECVSRYQAETGDRNISTLRYLRTSSLGPIGACYHPHLCTHEKMAAELTSHIRQLECRSK